MKAIEVNSIDIIDNVENATIVLAKGNDIDSWMDEYKDENGNIQIPCNNHSAWLYLSNYENAKIIVSIIVYKNKIREIIVNL